MLYRDMYISPKWKLRCGVKATHTSELVSKPLPSAMVPLTLIDIKNGTSTSPLG